jgi:hypothetical protein
MDTATISAPVHAGLITAELVLPFGRFRLEELRQEHPEEWAHLLHPDSRLTRYFLAEETVRLGGRGQAVVGRAFDGADELPLTGVEGYFVDTPRQVYDPKEPGRDAGDRRTPADVVRIIAYTGVELLDHVEHDLDTRYLSAHDTTAREVLRWIEARAMDETFLHCVNGVYGAILGVLRANSNPALAAFRDETYRLLVGLPRLHVVVSDEAITLRYSVPRAAPAEPFTTRVTLTPRLRHGYEVMAAIGPYMGNPVTRLYLQGGS